MNLEKHYSKNIWNEVSSRFYFHTSKIQTFDFGNWFWLLGRIGITYIYLFPQCLCSIGKYFHVLSKNLCLFFFHRLRGLKESDTIYKRIEVTGGAISDGPWKEIWKKYSGTCEWPKLCRVLGCSNDASIGAHVGINTNERYYILPMCNNCRFNGDYIIKLKAKSAAVPIYKRDIKWMLKVKCHP